MSDEINQLRKIISTTVSRIVALEEKAKSNSSVSSPPESRSDLAEQLSKLELVVKAQQASIVTLRDKIGAGTSPNAGTGTNDIASILLRMAKQDARILALEEQLQKLSAEQSAVATAATPAPAVLPPPVQASNLPPPVQASSLPPPAVVPVAAKPVEEKPKPEVVEEKKKEEVVVKEEEKAPAAEKVEEENSKEPTDVLSLLGDTTTAPPLTSIKKGGARKKGTRRIPTKKLAELSAEIAKEEDAMKLEENSAATAAAATSSSSEAQEAPPPVEEKEAPVTKKVGGSSIARMGGMGFNLSGMDEAIKQGARRRAESFGKGALPEVRRASAPVINPADLPPPPGPSMLKKSSPAVKPNDEPKEQMGSPGPSMLKKSSHQPKPAGGAAPGAGPGSPGPQMLRRGSLKSVPASKNAGAKAGAAPVGPHLLKKSGSYKGPPPKK